MVKIFAQKSFKQSLRSRSLFAFLTLFFFVLVQVDWNDKRGSHRGRHGRGSAFDRLPDDLIKDQVIGLIFFIEIQF
jgi:hypothetical protein